MEYTYLVKLDYNLESLAGSQGNQVSSFHERKSLHFYNFLQHSDKQDLLENIEETLLIHCWVSLVSRLVMQESNWHLHQMIYNFCMLILIQMPAIDLGFCKSVFQENEVKCMAKLQINYELIDQDLYIEDSWYELVMHHIQLTVCYLLELVMLGCRLEKQLLPRMVIEDMDY